MRSLEATPTPAVLGWARETAGMSLSLAAQKAKIKPELLAEWEAGTLRPSIAQLRRLANLYRRPLAVFYLPEPPRRFQVMHDFRRPHRHELALEDSPKLAFEIRRAYDRREWALELMEEIGEEPKAFDGSANPNESAEDVALRLRTIVRVSLEDQRNWRADNEAFKQWRLALEAAGILTMQTTDVSLAEVRGFSVSLRPLPVVVVNIKDAPRGRIFTLLHEAAHVMLNEGGICDLHDADVEAFCNRVAGAALFPKDAILSSAVVRAHKKGDPVWQDSELRDLSREFGGSREAALVRLLTLKLTSQSFYEQMKAEFLRQYAEQQRRREESEGHPLPHVIAIASAGPFFTSLVVESLNRDKITASDVSDYLQIRLKHLKDLQGEFSREGA